MKKYSSGQVAVEFLLMFIFVAILLLYLFRFAVTTTALQFREYAAFMVGRAITSSAVSYEQKKNYALIVLEDYNKSSAMEITLASGGKNRLECNESINGGVNTAFKYVLQYGTGITPDSVSNTGIACSTYIDQILPNTNEFRVVIEAMTGSEISDAHCFCCMDFTQDWMSCINSTQNSSPSGAQIGLLDNGC